MLDCIRFIENYCIVLNMTEGRTVAVVILIVTALRFDLSCVISKFKFR